MEMTPIQGSVYSPAHQPVAMLMLIENSLTMSHVWSDLRDQYLVSLVDTLTAANTESSTPITVSVLESYPCQDHGPNPFLPRQYSGYHDRLRDVKFNTNPENRISIGRINHCIDLLDSFKYQGQPAALHLIIVAATAPSDDNTETTVSGSDYSPWIFLAKKMAGKHIHCHIVVSPQHDTGSLTMLFEETLRLQNNVEGQLYPPADPSKMVLRLSAKPNQQIYTASSNLYRLPVPRRNSYPNPAENYYPEGFESVSAPAPSEGEPPSLVSQLQQVHGLTKKKVYGAKPTRQPFFRDERVRDKYRNPPTPLTMPLPVVDQSPSPTAGGKVISHSRADRMARVGQGSSSPTELHSRRQHGWPRRGSRLSTPEADNLAWPPASPSAYHDTSPRSSFMSSVSSDISSPVTPGATMDEMYGVPKPLASTPSTSIHAMAPGVMTGYQTGGVPEPNWAQQQQQQQQPPYADAYSAMGTSYFPPQPAPPPQFYTPNGEFAHSNDMQVQQQLNPALHAPAPASLPASSPYEYMMDSSPAAGLMLPATSAAPVLAPAPTSAPAPAPAARAQPKRTPPQEDEERFTFSREFFAATEVLFDEEVLPAYPNYPGMSSGLTAHGGVQAPLPLPPSAPQPGELYATRVRSGHPAQVQPRAAHQQGAGGGAHGHGYGHGYGHGHGHGHGHARAPYAGVYANGYQVYNAPAHPAAYGSSLTGWAG